MRFLADENFPFSAVKALREKGYDVAWIRTRAPGIDDIGVLRLAQSENRTILTFDKGFGRLLRKAENPFSSGIILFRLSPSSPEQIAQITLEVIGSRTDWTGLNVVVHEDRMRIKKLFDKT